MTLALLKSKFDTTELDKLLYEHGIASSHQGLTNAQARYLANFKHADALRNRILAEKSERRDEGNRGLPGQGGTENSAGGEVEPESRFATGDFPPDTNRRLADSKGVNP